MTFEQRLVHLQELADKAWPNGHSNPQLLIGPNHAMVWCVDNDLCLLNAGNIDRLDAALCLLAGEIPTWVSELATEWEGDLATYPDFDQRAEAARIAVRLCAKELRAAATKAGAR